MIRSPMRATPIITIAVPDRRVTHRAAAGLARSTVRPPAPTAN